jgi:hypothetical protein
LLWKLTGMMIQGILLALTGDAPNAVEKIISAMIGLPSTGATVWKPWYSSILALAYAALDQFDDAWRCINER